MGIEGPGGGANLKGGQNGGVHFQKALAVQEVPQLPEDEAALDKGILDLGVDDQIHITLTVAGLPVGQAVELFRQGQQTLAEQSSLVDPQGDFSPLGLEHVTLYAHDVANVIFLKAGKIRLVHGVKPDIELNSAGVVLQIAERHLAHAPLAHQAARQSYGLALQGLIVFLDLLGGGGHFILGLHIGVPAFGPEGFQLLPADLHLVGQGHFCLWYKLCHGLALTRNADDLHAEGTGRGVNGKVLSGSLAHDAAAEGRVVRELVFHGVGFLRAGDAVLEALAVLVLYNYGADQTHVGAYRIKYSLYFCETPGNLLDYPGVFLYNIQSYGNFQLRKDFEYG